MSTSFRIGVLLVTLALFLCIPGVALGYGGPGSVISGIGAFLAAVAAVLATLFGFIWFPLKRLYQKMTGSQEGESGTGAGKEAPSEETAAGQQIE